MAKKRKTHEVEIELIRAVKELGIAFFDAATANPIMATAGGMLPFVLLSLLAPGPALVGEAAVGGIAGLSQLPHFQLGWGLFSFAPSSSENPWPVNVTIMRDGERRRTESKEVEEAKMLLKTLGVQALKTL